MPESSLPGLAMPQDSRTFREILAGQASAPELAAAMAETRLVRDGYRALCEEFGPSPQTGWSARISLTVLNRHLAKAGLWELPRAPRDDREDITLRYRRERDEARAVVAEMIAAYGHIGRDHWISEVAGSRLPEWHDRAGLEGGAGE